jgi:hypothetical protein
MGNVKQGKPKGAAGKAEVIQREAEIIRLRRGGLTWDMIAERTGYSSGLSARAAYERGMARYVQADVNELVQLESERLDIAQAAIWQNVLAGDNPSIISLMRIMERRAKLLGLDAAQNINLKAEVVTYDADGINTELANIIQLIHSSTSGNVDREISASEPTAD